MTRSYRIHQIRDIEVVRCRNEYANGCRPSARYASFDYCYNFFRKFAQEDCTSPSDQQFRESALLHLGFYLASWGMLRNSFLAERSVVGLLPILDAISATPRNVWNFDIPDYAKNDAVEEILAAKERITSSFATERKSETLVTKIMLGVFGCTPALDRFFRLSTGLHALNRRTMNEVHQFYVEHSEAIEDWRQFTLNIDSGENTTHRYTAAKVVDMVFFQRGIEMASGNY